MRVTTLLIICVALAGCELKATTPPSCAAAKPHLSDTTVADGYFIISEADMGQLTGYMAALEEGCIAPK